MKWSALLLVLAAGLAVFWYSRRGNSRSEVPGSASDAYRLQAPPSNQHRSQGSIPPSSTSTPRPEQILSADGFYRQKTFSS